MCVLIQHITSSLSSFTFQNDFLAVLFLHSLSAHLSHCSLTVHKVFSPVFVLQTRNSAGFKTSSKKTLEDACLVCVKAEGIRPSKQLKDTVPTPSDQAMPRVLFPVCKCKKGPDVSGAAQGSSLWCQEKNARRRWRLRHTLGSQGGGSWSYPAIGRHQPGP